MWKKEGEKSLEETAKGKAERKALGKERKLLKIQVV